MNICVTKWPRKCLVCGNHNHVLLSWFLTAFVTRVPLGKQGQLTLKKHMISPLVVESFMLLNLVSCVAFCGWLFVLFFGHCMVDLSTSDLWLGIEYPQTLFTCLILYICLYCTLFYMENNRHFHFQTVSLFRHPVNHFYDTTPEVLLLWIYLHIF